MQHFSKKGSIDINIDMSKVMSVMTDEKTNMVRKKKVGFVKLFMEAIGQPVVLFHCINHQEICVPR